MSTGLQDNARIIYQAVRTNNLHELPDTVDFTAPMHMDEWVTYSNALMYVCLRNTRPSGSTEIIMAQHMLRRSKFSRQQLNDVLRIVLQPIPDELHTYELENVSAFARILVDFDARPCDFYRCSQAMQNNRQIYDKLTARVAERNAHRAAIRALYVAAKWRRIKGPLGRDLLRLIADNIAL